MKFAIMGTSAISLPKRRIEKQSVRTRSAQLGVFSATHDMTTFAAFPEFRSGERFTIHHPTTLSGFNPS
jgi:hypothetical protein